MKTTRKNEEFPFMPGVDRSDQKHDICLWDAEGQTIEFDVVKHRPEVLHDWICKLRDRYPGPQVSVCEDWPESVREIGPGWEPKKGRFIDPEVGGADTRKGTRWGAALGLGI